MNIPNSVTSIGSGAFAGCTGLTTLEIPNSVTSIEVHSFSDCSGLTSIVVDEGNRKYDSRNNCNAIIETNSNTLITGCKNTTFPSSVTGIGNFAFYGCSDLSSMSIPNNVTTIGLGILIGCSGLTSIVVEEGNSNYDSRDNCNAIIETETNTLIAGCKNTIIPNSVTSIGAGVFYGCSNITSLSIPESVKTIGISAFRNCTGLTTVTIPNNVTSIGDQAFENCTALSSVTIGSGVTSIGYRAFYDCTGLESVISMIEEPFEIKESVFCYLDKETYSNQLFTTATLYVPQGTKTKYMATSAWSKFGDNIVEIEDVPNPSLKFEYDDETMTATLTDGKAATGDVVIPAVVNHDGKVYSVTSIGGYAFYNCTDLTSIVIPNSVTSIGERAFNRCTGLTSIVVESGNTTYDSRDNCNAIIESSTNTLIAGCNNTAIPNSVTSIGDWVFSFYTGLTSIEIPNSVTNIGTYAFYGCSGLTTIEIPNSVTSIGGWAFDDCTGLTTIKIPNSLISIGNGAFSDCPSLTSVVSEIQEPFEIEKGVFEYFDYDASSYFFTSATLYVPKGTKEKYLATPVWNLFGENIVEMENPTGIKSARNNEETEKMESYDLNGCRLNTPKKGLNIIRMSDGTTKKVVIK